MNKLYLESATGGGAGEGELGPVPHVTQVLLHRPHPLILPLTKPNERESLMSWALFHTLPRSSCTVHTCSYCTLTKPSEGESLMIFPGSFMYCNCYLFAPLSTYHRQSYSGLECISVKVNNVKVSNVKVSSVKVSNVLVFLHFQLYSQTLHCGLYAFTIRNTGTSKCCRTGILVMYVVRSYVLNFVTCKFATGNSIIGTSRRDFSNFVLFLLIYLSILNGNVLASITIHSCYV